MPIITGKQYETIKVHRPNGTRYSEASVEKAGARFLTVTELAISQALEAFVAEFGARPGDRGWVVIETIVIGSKATTTIFELAKE